MPVRVGLAFTLCVSLALVLPMGPARSAGFQSSGVHQPVGQILEDLEAAGKAVPNYPMPSQLDPRYRAQMKREMTPVLQKIYELDDELAEADPSRANALRFSKCDLLARLSLYEDKNALKILTDASNSAVASDAIFGKVGLMMYRWWDKPDAATQKQVLDDFAPLAKANPKDDAVAHAALLMARYGTSSDGLADALRDIVEKDLKGTAAEQYRRKPDKIGRPFTLNVRGFDGKPISTAAWHGKVVLLDFWATWCPPCNEALPNLIKLYQENHDKGLEIAGISNDSSALDLRQFLTAHPDMKWPESFDPGGPDGWNVLSHQLGIDVIPTSYVIDRNGMLRDVEPGYLDEGLVKNFLDEPVKPQAMSEAPQKPGQSAPSTQATDSTPAPTAKPANAPAPPSVATQTLDQQANEMLSLANSYVSANLPDKAKEKLNQLLKKYPNTKVASKAKELLDQLNAQ